MEREEAKLWIKTNWGHLVAKGKIGEVLKRYFKKYGFRHPSQESYVEQKELLPDETKKV